MFCMLPFELSFTLFAIPFDLTVPSLNLIALFEESFFLISFIKSGDLFKSLTRFETKLSLLFPSFMFTSSKLVFCEPFLSSDDLIFVLSYSSSSFVL